VLLNLVGETIKTGLKVKTWVLTNLVEKTIGNYDAKLEAINNPKQEVSPVLETLVSQECKVELN
jgi:hypothetical protein